jgi:plastocyanin
MTWSVVRRCALVCCALVTISCSAAPTQNAPTATMTATAPVTATDTSTPTSTASPAPTTAVMLIEMGDNFFDPAQLTVKVGTTVTWKVVGQSTHDLAARDGSFIDRTMSFGQTFSFTFTKAGTYAYVCMQHEGDGMTGAVTVVDQ